jgi:calcium-dependent protein kinase
MGCFPSSKPSTKKSVSVTPASESGFSHRYIRLGVLWQGPYSTIFSVQHQTSGLLFSAQTLRKEPVAAAAPLSSDIKNREFALISSLSHPNLVRMMEWIDTKREYVFVMEALEGEPLSAKVARSVLSEAEVRELMRQVFSAIAHCHNKRVLHRDLCLDTIWVSRNTAKIALFGTLSFFDAAKCTSGRGGSAYYIAPELIDSIYDEQCDLWSCGVILHILLAGFPPFEGSSDLETARKIKEDLIDFHRSPYSHLSDPAKDLLHLLLIKNPLYRITAEETLAHSWVKSEVPHPLSDQARAQLASLLAGFTARSRLKDSLYSFIVTHVLSNQDLEAARTLFLRLDRNGDGKLSREEVQSELQSEFGQFHDVIAQLDTDHSGFIDYNEFLKATVEKSKLTAAKTLKTAFDLLDKDNSGGISSEELRDMLLSTGVVQLQAGWTDLLAQVDANGDHMLDLKEFLALLQAL